MILDRLAFTSEGQIVAGIVELALVWLVLRSLGRFLSRPSLTEGATA